MLESSLIEVDIVYTSGGNPPGGGNECMEAFPRCEGKVEKIVVGEHRWPGLRLGVEMWLLALRKGGLFGFFPRPRPGPPRARELKTGGVQVVVVAAHDCPVGVDGLGVLGSGDGVRSRMCDIWLMILEVTVSGLRKGGGTACIENGGEVKVAVAGGEIAEKGNAIVEAECGLHDVLVLS